MPELLLELLSEEIPSRMQKAAADNLRMLLIGTLSSLSPSQIKTFYGPRRIAAMADVLDFLPATSRTERGPRTTAPDAAKLGFMRKHGAEEGQLSQEGDYWMLRVVEPARSAAEYIAEVMPGLLRRFPWPKSMRWGSSGFTWVRPLRRILCLLNETVVPFDLRNGMDDGHELASSNLTEGHRFLSPGAVVVRSAKDWQEALLNRHVIVSATERRARIADGIVALAAAVGLTVVADEALLDEVAGLVEWPVPLLGRINPEFMDLPPEVMQVSMRVNQRYFALRAAEGATAPWFALVANVVAPDGGAAIVAGNERVLRARFSDARHFWDLDRKAKLESRVQALQRVTYHEKLGSQADRVERLAHLAREHIVPQLVRPSSYPTDALYKAHLSSVQEQAALAARLSKADLTTGMVGEFPELQGVMGSYYAQHDYADRVSQHRDVITAIREHYLPRGVADPIPETEVGTAVALADRIDQLVAFFSIGEKPTGSGDPFALRRAALGIIRIILEQRRWIRLTPILRAASRLFERDDLDGEILAFIVDRLKTQLRALGHRHDIIDAATAGVMSDDIRVLAVRTEALTGFYSSSRDLITAYRRAANILGIEERRDGCTYAQPPSEDLLSEEQERDFNRSVRRVRHSVEGALRNEDFYRALAALSELRNPTDRLFELTINDPVSEVRRNRLRLLSSLRDTMNLFADFSKIEG